MSEKELQLMYSYESLDYDIPTVGRFPVPRPSRLEPNVVRRMTYIAVIA
jgi:hypothetical protein